MCGRPVSGVQLSQKSILLVLVAGALAFSGCSREKPAKVEALATPTAAVDKTPVPGNKLPAVGRIRITPETPKTLDDLRVEVSADDKDGQAITYQYQWYLNDEKLMGEIGDSFPASKTSHGDRLAVEVTPFDGKEQGKPKRSPEVTVRNTPPELKSQLSAGVSLDGFRFEVTDVDNDPITFQISGNPPNMTLSPEGVLRWKPSPTDKAGEYEVTVVASDGQGGNVTVKFPIRVTAPVNPG